MSAAVVSSFGIPKVSGPESACIYFGVSRLADLRRTAKNLEMPLSTFVNRAIDQAVHVNRERQQKLKIYAMKHNLSPAEALNHLIDSCY